MSDYKVTDSELTSIANAIRTKGGTSSPLEFPSGFVSAINAIPTGGGDVVIDFFDYAQFDNNNDCIELPFTYDADYMITVDFYADYITNQSIFGNNSSFVYPFLTQYNGIWYTSNGQGEVNFSAATTGRHVFISNKNNSNYFDGNVIGGYTAYASQSNVSILVGDRPIYNGGPFRGKLYKFTIESISSGEKVCELNPARVSQSGSIILAACLYDSVNKKFYSNRIASVGNDS